MMPGAEIEACRDEHRAVNDATRFSLHQAQNACVVIQLIEPAEPSEAIKPSTEPPHLPLRGPLAP